MGVTREKLEKYCSGKPFALSEQADEVLEAVSKRDGCCPCRVEAVPCPCPMHRQEIEEQGRCHCNLFVKTE